MKRKFITQKAKLHRELALMQELLRRKKEPHLCFKPYAKQKQFFDYGKDFSQRAFFAGNQLGKALDSRVRVLTVNGWRRIGALSVGDKVFSGDGTVTSVVGVYPQGVRELYRITFDRGETIDADLDHLWKVNAPNSRCEYRWSHGGKEKNPFFGNETVVTTKSMVEKYGLNPKPKYRYTIDPVKPIQFPRKNVPLDPYLLGCLIGDGSFVQGSVTISNPDYEIIDWIKRVVPPGVDVNLINDSAGINYTFSAKNTVYQKGEHPVISPLKDLGLYGHRANSKFVPDLYKFNDCTTRLSVLQGLLDTDGYCGKDGTIQYCTVSRTLSTDVKFIVESFGGKVRIYEKDPKYSYKGKVLSGQLAYQLTIRLPDQKVFRLKRKLARTFKPTSTCSSRVIHSFEKIAPGKAVCISVDHQDHTFVTEHCIVTHNTVSAAQEAFYHATGHYPDWWEGRVFTQANVGWVGGDTGETIRDTTQRILFDRPGKMDEDDYVGVVPKRMIIGKPVPARGIADLYDHVKILHKTGGTSYIYFKAYSKGRKKFQGETIDWIWFDEEPPADVYSEGLTRTNNGANGQFAFLTFTPLLGMSEIVYGFLKERKLGQVSLTMTIHDVEHYTDEEKEIIIASYPDHEREARANGTPILGSGLIFPIAESKIKCDKIHNPPDFWRRLRGIDFGWDHPSAIVEILHDADNDIIYAYRAYRRNEVTPLEFYSAIKPWGDDWVPVSWPHDGLQHDKGSGIQLKEQYKSAGMNMLEEKATWADGSNGVEAGVIEMLQRFRAGTLVIDETLTELFDELRMYHRKNGVIIKERDDLISALRYAIMMIRFASSKAEAVEKNRTEPKWKQKLKNHIRRNRPKGAMVA